MTSSDPASAPFPPQGSAASQPGPVPFAAGPASPPADAIPPLPPVPGTANRLSTETAELGKLLIEADLTLAIAESLTGGALAAEIVRVPGISASFMGAVVAYQLILKHRLLGVDADLLAREGAVHPEVAVQMARGVRSACQLDERAVDLGLATTGVAGPGSEDGVEPGIVFVGISSLWGEKSIALDFRSLVRADDPLGSRQRIRAATVEAAVFDLVDFLQEQV